MQELAAQGSGWPKTRRTITLTLEWYLARQKSATFKFESAEALDVDAHATYLDLLITGLSSARNYQKICQLIAWKQEKLLVISSICVAIS